MKRHTIKSAHDGQGVYWHPDNKGPLNTLPYILMFGSMKFSKVRMDYTMYPHMHPGIGFRFIHSGNYHWEVEGQEIELLPDDICIVNSWQRYGSPYGKTDIGDYSWMVIQPESFGIDKSLHLGPWSQIPLGLQEDLGNLLKSDDVIILRKTKKFKKYFLELRRELKAQEKGYEIIVKNLISNFIIELYRHLSHQERQVKENDDFIINLTNLISQDLTKKWIIDDLAIQFGMGKTKFTDQVKKLTGYPPASFIINLKIEKSIEMLSEKQYSLSEIADVCGFFSLQHFNYTFSNRIGVSPGKYRKSESS